jgi:hypothetical protein
LFLLCCALLCGCEHYSVTGTGQILLVENGQLQHWWSIGIETEGPFDLKGPSFTSRYVRELPSNLDSQLTLCRLMHNRPLMPAAVLAIGPTVGYEHLYNDDYVVLGMQPILIGLRREPQDVWPKQPLKFSFVSDANLSDRIYRLYLIEGLSEKQMKRIVQEYSIPPDYRPQAAIKEVPLPQTITVGEIFRTRPWLDLASGSTTQPMAK